MPDRNADPSPHTSPLAPLLSAAPSSTFADALLAALPAPAHAALPDAFSPLPADYLAAHPPDAVAADLLELLALSPSTPPRLLLTPASDAPTDALLRIYSADLLLLSDLFPLLDHFGLTVVAQRAFAFPAPHPTTPPRHLSVFRIRRGPFDTLAQAANLTAALTATLTGVVSDDRLNGLLLPARLTWQDVDLIRGYTGYMRQIAELPPADALAATLATHATLITDLVALFHARFDPARATDRPARVAALTARLDRALDAVTSFEEDQLLRRLIALITATVRTNAFISDRATRAGVHYTSFKLDCAQVPDLPAPRPLFEIWVHAAATEGIHLRGARVARGGLRWSDRPNDFRREIAGLMATQDRKNTVIVPAGAKGGFVLKNPPPAPAAARQAADRLYEVFVRALLDLTDNLVAQTPVPPPAVVCYDPPDPYLVVAADKGTAHLSDTANRLAAAYHFWLGDAFASGGSVGYSHKDWGITARGAWVCVRRHFHELGLDPEQAPITCVGIGDMSGDVFGNGLLRSKSLHLFGAFDHRHVFIDPGPTDPAQAFAERARLFALKGSSWADYDASLIAPGGGVFPRDAKAIPLSPELAARLGAPTPHVSGNTLIQLLLQADVDLLWNGGIGTYIKASHETHHDAADPSSDRVRVDADRLRCRVIAEGGNLGLTQAARIEFSARGGHVNADAIDNSGGVDLSDHEVNLKTLLAAPIAAGTLSTADRASLIASFGEEVCALVLTNNFNQALALSLDVARSRRDLWAFHHTITWLEQAVALSRTTELLPATAAAIAQRSLSGDGLYRPELTRLLAASKKALTQALLDEPPGTVASLTPFVRAYFPQAIARRFPAAVTEHFLFSDIAATVLANHLIDAAGVTLIPELVTATERSPSQCAAAWFIAERLLGAVPLRAALRADTTTATPILYDALLRLEDALHTLARTLLWATPGELKLDHLIKFQAVSDAAATIEADLERFQSAPQRAHTAELRATYLAAGLSDVHVSALVSAPQRAHAASVYALVRDTGRSTADAATAFFAAALGTHTLALAADVSSQSWPDPWDFIAVGPVLRGLYAVTRDLAELALDRGLDLLKDPKLVALADEIASASRAHVPVSALIVLSDRLRQRIRATRLAN